MEKQPKCSYCETFDEKPHCHNCKVFKKAVTNRDPQEIPYSLEEMVKYIKDPQSTFDGDFRVGDYKDVTLYGGEKIRIVLIDTEVDDLADGSGKAKTTFAVMPVDGAYEMNLEATNAGGYVASRMRNYILPRYLALLPEELRKEIKPVTKKTYTGSSITTSSESIWLFSEIEIGWRNAYSQPGEGEGYEYFFVAKNRPSSEYVWTRSIKGSQSFCIAHSKYLDYTYSNNRYKVAFGFCI